MKKHLKRFVVFFLHLACTVGVQYFLLRILLTEDLSVRAPYFRNLSLSLLLCAVDFSAGCFLLKGHGIGRFPYMALQLWDLLLTSPMIVLAALGLASGGDGTGFGIAVLLTELFLIIERSTSFVLFDPKRAER